MAAAGPSNSGQKRWELENRIGEAEESVFRYNEQEQKVRWVHRGGAGGRSFEDIRSAKPWEKDPHYFTEVRISALALLKMVMHARSGGNLEIMGLLQGKVDAHTMIVMDSFALPVEGTETRVNAQAQAYEYMTTYTENCEPVRRLEKVIGWYHSHPGYGCWLSGIDVSTQMLNQQYQEPFVAIVVDPIRTISAGKVDLGAFRTYPKGYKPPDDAGSEYQSIPLNKIEDFGVHCKSYYSLDVSYFKSGLDNQLLDSLWNKYWVKTLSTTALVTNAAYITNQLSDVAEKLEGAEAALSRGAGVFALSEIPDRKHDDKFQKTIKDSSKLSCELVQGLMSQLIKDDLFNFTPTVNGAKATPPTDASMSDLSKVVETSDKLEA